MANLPPPESYATAQPRRITTLGERGELSLRTLSQMARVGGDGRAKRFG